MKHSWGDSHLLETRGKSLDTRFSYKLNTGGQYGLDVAYAEPSVNEREMSVTFPFADGNRRDGVGDLLEVEGIRCERHKLNPVVLFDHAKHVTLPIGLAEDPESKKYTVSIDPSSRQAKVKAFYYQGAGLGSADRTAEHALFCEQLFDLVCKRYIRAGSIGYQAVKAMRLPSNPTTGTPEGLHLIVTNLLEVSQVVVPANQDTVVKALSMPKICGKPISPHLIKSLSPYAPEKKVSLAWDSKSTVMRTDANDTPNGRQYTVSSVGARGKPRQLSDDSGSAREASARAHITARALNREDNTYEVDDQAKGKAVRLKYRSRAAKTTVTRDEKGITIRNEAHDTPGGHRTYTSNTHETGKPHGLSAVSTHGSSREAAEHARAVAGMYQGANIPVDEVDDQAKGKAVHITKLPGDQEYYAEDRGKTGKPHEEPYRGGVHMDADPSKTEVVRSAGRMIARSGQQNTKPIDETENSDEKRMRTYDNPLNNIDVPPAKWKPGVGVVKSIRLKYRGQKAVHITREDREINNATASGYRVTDRGKTGEGRSSHAGESGKAIKAVHIRRNANREIEIVDRGKTGEGNETIEVYRRHGYIEGAAQAEAPYWGRNNGGVVDETKPDADEKRMQTYDNPLNNIDIPPAKWKPGVGAVKDIRLKYRQQKNVHITRSGSGYRSTEKYKDGSDRLFMESATKQDAEQDARLLNAISPQQNTKPIDETVEEKAAHITREDRDINNGTIPGYRVTDRGKTGEGRSSTWTGSEANANLTAQQMAVNAGQQNTEPIDETRGKDIDAGSVSPSRMKIRRRGVVTTPTPVTPSPLTNEPATGVKSIRLKYRSGKNVHIERYGTGYHIENRGKTGRAVDVPGDQPLRTFAGGRNSAESAGRYLISQTNQQNTKPVDDTKD